MRTTKAIGIMAAVVAGLVLTLAPANAQRLVEERQLNPGGQVDQDGRINFGIGPGRGAPELKRDPNAELREGLLDIIRLFTDLPARLEQAFWWGGFHYGIITTCSIFGAVALLIVLFRPRN